MDNQGHSIVARGRIRVADLAKALLKRWGRSACKQRIWDGEYSSGKWAYLDPSVAVGEQPRDSVLQIIEKYAASGEILDLGCGAGATGLEISDTYSHYVGVDISEVAIRRAKLAARQQPSRARKNDYQVADISQFAPDRLFSVILFRESIYYIPERRIAETLRRFAPFLAPPGVFIVRVHDREKYRGVLDMIEREYEVVERNLPGSGRAATLVFRPRK